MGFFLSAVRTISHTRKFVCFETKLGCIPLFSYPPLSYLSSVLHCWSDSKRGDASLRAEALFRKMKARFEDGDEYLRPDHVAYSNLINAFAKGDGFVHAEKLLWEMVDDYLNGNDACKPRIRNLNTIIACWSRVSARHSPENAERIVGRWIRVTEETKLDTYPDSYTFSLLLKCW